jgi:hypothetical protein
MEPNGAGSGNKRKMTEIVVYGISPMQTISLDIKG